MTRSAFLLLVICFFNISCIPPRAKSIHELKYAAAHYGGSVNLTVAVSPNSFGYMADILYKPNDSLQCYIFIGDSLEKLDSMKVQPLKKTINKDGFVVYQYGDFNYVRVYLSQGRVTNIEVYKWTLLF